MNRFSRFYPQMRKAIPALILIVGAGLSYLAFIEARRVDDQKVLAAFDIRAQFRTNTVADRLRDATVPVESLATFISTQKKLDPDEFHGFATEARGTDPIIHLTWAPRVPGDQRALYEAKVRQEDALPSYSILERDATDRFVPAGERGEYYPVRFEERFDDPVSLLGFDHLSGRNRLVAAEHARDVGEPIATSAVRLLPNEKAGDRFVLFWPVYRRGRVLETVEDRRAAILGVVTGAFRLDDVVEFAVSKLPPVAARLSVFYGQLPDRVRGAPTVENDLATGRTLPGPTGFGSPDPDGLRLTKSFYEFGQSWTLVFDFAPELVAATKSPGRWGYPLLGLVLTLALAAYVLSQQRRQSVIEAQVAERTQELNRTTAQIRGIIESSPLAMGSADPDRRIRIWNKAAERLFGYSAEEIVGTTNFLAPPDEEERVLEFAKQLLKGEVFRGVESRNMRKDGTSFESAISAAAFFNSAGVPQGLVFTVEDISERKQQEAVEREITERLQAIVDTAVDGIIMIDAQGSALLFNPAAERLFGYAANEVIGRNIKMLMPPPFADEHDGYLGHYRGTGERKIIGIGREVVGRRKDGTTFPMHLAVGEAKQYGRPIFVGVVHDLTAQREVDSVLRQTQVLLSGIVDSSDDAIISKTSDGIVTSWNEAAFRVFGYTAEEMIGRHISAIAVPGHENDLTAILERIRRGERVAHYETQRRRKDGSIREISLTVSPLYDADGKIFGASKIARDITDQKAAEEALIRSRQHLERVQSVAKIGSIEVDLGTQTATWSDEMFRLLDLDPQTALPSVDTFTAAVHPSDRVIVRELSAQARRGQESEPREFRVIRSDGTSRWLYHHSVILSEGDHPVRHLATMYDITERKLAEEALRRNQEHLARVQSVAHIGSSEIDLTTGEVIWSDEVYLLLGIDKNMSKPDVELFAKVVHPEDREFVRDVGLKERNGQEVDPIEFRVVAPSGLTRWLYQKAAFIRDANGEATRLIATMYDITDRKQSEEALRESERQFAVMFHDSPVAIWISDLSNRGQIIDANRAWLDTFGLERDEVLGRTGEELNLWPDAQTRDAMYAATMKSGAVWNGEVVLRRRNGDLMDTAITMRHTEIDGRPRAIGVGIDITERKKAEEALRHSQEHLARVQSIARIGSTEVDLDTGEAVWSDEIYRLLGVNPASIQTGVDSFADAVHPDDREALREASRKGRSGQDAPPLEFRVIDSDGQTHWFYRTADFVRDADGRPKRVIATMYDVTERKLAEEASRESQQRFEAIFRDSPAGILITELARGGRIIETNDAWLKTVGYARDEMIGRTSAELDLWVNPEDREKLFVELSKSDAPVSAEVRLRRKDRTIVDYATTMRRMEIAGRPYLIALGFDITERKESETKRVHLEKQLQQSQKMEAIGQLTGGVAHDFNNLLMVMLGNLELIQEQVGENDKVSPWVADALSAGKSGSDLTYRLLAFSRRQALEPEATDINRRISGFVPLIRRAIGEAVEIRQKLVESVWPVMIDPSQFDNAILNLSVNARDAMPGGGWIEIATENVSVDEAYAAQIVDLNAGDFVRVTVSDSGTGMPPDVLARAFDPFFTTKEVGKGTGLGLSMVYGFMKQSKGNATIYSEIGKGTVIRLLLPRAAGDTGTDSRVKESEKTASGGDVTILIVEDDAKVRKVTVAFLASLGYGTLDAGTGNEALALLAAHPEIALLLSDVILAGGETGPAVAARAKQIRPDLKIMFASGYTEDALERNGHLDSDVILLRKPFTKSALSTKVREALERI